MSVFHRGFELKPPGFKQFVHTLPTAIPQHSNKKLEMFNKVDGKNEYNKINVTSFFVECFRKCLSQWCNQLCKE